MERGRAGGARGDVYGCPEPNWRGPGWSSHDGFSGLFAQKLRNRYYWVRAYQIGSSCVSDSMYHSVRLSKPNTDEQERKEKKRILDRQDIFIFRKHSNHCFLKPPHSRKQTDKKKHVLCAIIYHTAFWRAPRQLSLPGEILVESGQSGGGVFATYIVYYFVLCHLHPIGSHKVVRVCVWERVVVVCTYYYYTQYYLSETASPRPTEREVVWTAHAWYVGTLKLKNCCLVERGEDVCYVLVFTCILFPPASGLWGAVVVGLTG